MLRIFMSACFVFIFLAACGRGEDSTVSSAPRELVDVEIDATVGCRLSFRLPDADWRRVEDPAFKGFRYDKAGRDLRVRIFLKDAAFRSAAVEAEAHAGGAEIRAFEAWSSWPFVGIVVEYRGPPDAAMLETFVHTFKVERR